MESEKKVLEAVALLRQAGWLDLLKEGALAPTRPACRASAGVAAAVAACSPPRGSAACKVRGPSRGVGTRGGPGAGKRSVPGRGRVGIPQGCPGLWAALGGVRAFFQRQSGGRSLTGPRLGRPRLKAIVGRSSRATVMGVGIRRRVRAGSGWAEPGLVNRGRLTRRLLLQPRFVQVRGFPIRGQLDFGEEDPGEQDAARGRWGEEKAGPWAASRIASSGGSKRRIGAADASNGRCGGEGVAPPVAAAQKEQRPGPSRRRSKQRGEYSSCVRCGGSGASVFGWEERSEESLEEGELRNSGSEYEWWESGGRGTSNPVRKSLQVQRVATRCGERRGQRKGGEARTVQERPPLLSPDVKKGNYVAKGKMACVSVRNDSEECLEFDGEHRGMVLSLKQGNVIGIEYSMRYGDVSCDHHEVVDDRSGEGELMQTCDSDVNVAVGDTSVASRVKSNFRARRQPAKFKDFV
ncbi:hypothetical protein NDU88_006863 [Pleurodeles waltl]|uniref:Uncharacterized protein n=1 Tax=Pleurodeles waltl TaxID=8319 RepID=A0AAV7SR13_PLEWA|nr:hypothetical protein NDU88_006863 [Pleurodeles waltl]